MAQAVIADLRSDTVTQPTDAMRAAMMAAPLGDDVLGDDPSVIRLQEQAAALLGKDAALFTPSGTMANQIAIRLHASAGDEVLCHPDSHVYFYESGAPAALSGASVRFVPGPRGQFTADDLRALLRPADAHFPPAVLIVLENTHNRGGGSIWPLQQFAAVCQAAHQAGLAVHLDGARLMNACVAAGLSPRDYTRHVDTVSMCFSKGLGAPVGSIVAGPSSLMQRAVRIRKLFGGGMRQAGLLAAAASYALEHHVERLAEDHAKARHLAAVLAGADVRIANQVETNIVYFDIDPHAGTAAEACEQLRAAGVWTLAESRQRVRAVTHLNVTRESVERAGEIMTRVLSRPQPLNDPR